MSSAGSWRYSIWPCAEAFGSPTFCSIDYGPSLVNLRKFAEADFGSAREAPRESSDLPAVRISRPRAPGPGRCRSRPCRAAPQSAHGDELALSSLRPELQQSSPCASYETSQVTACPRGGSPDKEAFWCVEITHTGGVQHPGTPAGRCDHQDLGTLVVARESAIESAIHPDADLVSDAHQPALDSSHRDRVLSISDHELLQRRDQPHHIVDIALTLGPRPPLGQRQLGADLSIPSRHGLQVCDEFTAGRHQGDLIVQPEGAIVHVAGSDDRDHVVDGEVFGVQDGRLWILIDLDACLEQHLVVGSLSVLDDELVGLLRYK